MNEENKAVERIQVLKDGVFMGGWQEAGFVVAPKPANGRRKESIPGKGPCAQRSLLGGKVEFCLIGNDGYAVALKDEDGKELGQTMTDEGLFALYAGFAVQKAELAAQRAELTKTATGSGIPVETVAKMISDAIAPLTARIAALEELLVKSASPTEN